MTRIIAGSVGGRRIRVPAGTSTRPTSDRVREALFSALESEVGSLTGLRLLDLFAGSGAIGIEARSRGAGHVTLVEQDKKAAALIKRNCSDLDLSGCEVVALPAERVVAAPPQAPFDIVFADPPYSFPDDAVAALLESLVVNGWVVPGGLLVVERSSRGGDVVWPLAVTSARVRKYGETALWYGLVGSASP